MELIDRYIYQVGRHLPYKNREDIKTEIRSLIEDTMDDRLAEENTEVSEELAEQVLREFGSPNKMAAAYKKDSYLIGPSIYPVFTLVTKIVFAALALAFLVSGIVTSGFGADSGATVGTFIRDFVVSYVSALMPAIGNLVIVFAIIERFLPESKFDQDEESEWSPKDLPVIDEQAVLKPWEQIVRIIFSFVFILLFNFFTHLIGVYHFQDGQTFFVPLLAPAFEVYIPWLTVVWSIGILVSIILLIQQHWTSLTRWIEIIISGLEIAIATAIFQGPDIVAISPQANDTLRQMPLSDVVTGFETLVPLLNTVMKGVMLMIIVLNIIDIAKMTLALLRRDRLPVVVINKPKK
jgi:hypothetical protein